MCPFCPALVVVTSSDVITSVAAPSSVTTAPITGSPLARATIDPVLRLSLFKQIADIAADQFEVMGVSKSSSTYGIKRNGLMNVAPSMPSSWPYPTPAPALPQTWYWAR